MEKWLFFRNVAKWFRLVEICFALLLLPWLYSKLPFVATVSIIFTRHLITVATSPIFIFTLFNSILVSLYIKSGQFSGDLNSGDDNESEFYEEIAYFSQEKFVPVLDSREIVYQDKEMIDVASDELKEELMREGVEEECCENTEKSGEDTVAEEEISSEEFKRTVEDFIAKQMRFHQEEKMAIVVC